MNPWDDVFSVVLNHVGWSLLAMQRDGMGGIRTMLSAPTFEQLMRDAVTHGYLKPPIAIKLGEISGG